MGQHVLIDTTSFLFLINMVLVVVLWKLNTRTVRSEEASKGTNRRLDEIKNNDLMHIDKRLRFLTGVVIAHFPPHNEELKRQMDELDAID